MNDKKLNVIAVISRIDKTIHPAVTYDNFCTYGRIIDNVDMLVHHENNKYNINLRAGTAASFYKYVVFGKNKYGEIMAHVFSQSRFDKEFVLFSDYIVSDLTKKEKERNTSNE